MNIINAGYEFMTHIDGNEVLEKIEQAGRVCYKSEDLITEDSAKKFCENIIKRGHEAVLEHYSFTIKFVVDRGVSHEIVRHRVASYCQESTRYCNYSKDKFSNEITVIRPSFWRDNVESNDEYIKFAIWERSMCDAEAAYFELLEHGATPQEARSVLPNSLKTEVVMTANIREWRHFLRLRTSSAAHPQIREVAIPLLKELQEKVPVLFDDIEVE